MDDEPSSHQSKDMAESEDSTKRYRGVIDLTVTNNSHTQMFRLLQRRRGEQVGRVLEVGCSGGYFGEALKKVGHEVWGIEMNPEAAKEASEVLDKVYTQSIEDFFQLAEIKNERFDAIVFGDVLEHLADPGGTLRLCLGFLSEDGSVLVSVPNVAHQAVRLMLLEGRWDYADFGIMDNTHLRFFTKKTLVGLFHEAGYQVAEMGRVVLPNELTGIEVNPVLDRSTRGLIRDEDAEVFQYTLLAHRADPNVEVTQPKMVDFSSASRIVCVVPSVDWTVTQIRWFNPLMQFQAQNNVEVRFCSFGDFSSREFAWGDTFILQRDAGGSTLRLMDDLQRDGKTVIFDIDDLLTEIPDFLMTYQAMQKIKPDLIELLKMADMVTVSTEHLAEEMKAYNQNVMVVPNCVPVASRVTKHSQSRVKLLLASSDSVRVDFVISAIARVLEDKDLDLELVCIGPPSQAMEHASVPISQVHPCMSYGSFKEFLSNSDNTIGLVPLDDSRFSRCKSAVKYLDYASAGIPVICSKVAPYADVVDHGVTGILCENDTEAWVQAICELAASTQKREHIASNARSFANQTRSLDKLKPYHLRLFEQARSGSGQIGSQRLGLLRKALGRGRYRNKFFRMTRWLRPRYLLKAPSRAVEVMREHGVAELVRRMVRILRAS